MRRILTSSFAVIACLGITTNVALAAAGSSQADADPCFVQSHSAAMAVHMGHMADGNPGMIAAMSAPGAMGNMIGAPPFVMPCR